MSVPQRCSACSAAAEGAEKIIPRTRLPLRKRFGRRPLEIYVKDGKIAAVGQDLSALAAENELLDTIEDALEEGANVPLSGGKKIVDVDQIRDYLDEIRANLPGELRQAQQIVNDRAQIVETANAQAQAIVKKAEERARILVSEAEIVKAAQQRAGEITTAAQNEARTLRQTVTDYCDNMLKNTEETMVENAAQVKNVRANLRQNAKKNG